jgi:hypothetical protein
MDSIKQYAESEFRKTLINQLLKQAFANIKLQEYDEVTELVANKIKSMTTMRESLKTASHTSIAKTASDFNVDEDSILDSFIYFTLVVENVLLTKKLLELLSNKEN